MPLTLQVERHVLTTKTNDVPLFSSMKKYTRGGQAAPDPKRPGVILLLGHGAGFFKEIWEPVIEDLFDLENHEATISRPNIREIWALDCQNHGEACTLNEKTLSAKQDGLTIWDYADAFKTLYNSGLLGQLDPKLHNVVLCGHSAGAIATIFANSFFNPPYRIPFASLILIDPPIWPRAMMGQETDMFKFVEATTPIRRDIWKSSEAASGWLRSHPPWDRWDERVFNVFVKYGLRQLPTAYYPDKTHGVTLTTHKMAENTAFTGKKFSCDAFNHLSLICENLPVHLIFGANNDMFDRDMQDSMINPKEGRLIASVTRIEEAGHLVPQEAPKEVARAILRILSQHHHLSTKL